MEIFTKQLTSMDIQRGLVLPRCSLERLQSFHGTKELSTIFESAAGNRLGTMELSTIVESAEGTPLAEPVTIHCSTRSGRPAFTTGWYEIARYAGLTGGDIVYFYQEFSEGAQYRMRVRSAG
ncbi:hypothetical protein IMY05_003G0005000 [Salix suchowensis]|nr:hypothetical protein IMY05_003G0005000 [Salix suchowensis]